MKVINVIKRSYLWMLMFALPLVLVFPLDCEGGSISGRVTVDPTGEPIEGFAIYIYDSNGNLAFSQFGTHLSGYYTVDNLPTGDYYVRTWNDQGYIDEWYQDIKPEGGNSPPVYVDSEQDTPDINFALAIGGSISGRITAAHTGEPIEEMYVTVYDSNGDILIGPDYRSDQQGFYTVCGLPSGAYYVHARNNNLNYEPEWYQGAEPGAGVPPPVHVTAPYDTGNIDFALEAQGMISGRVTVDPTGESIEGVKIEACGLTGECKYGWSNSEGHYTVDGLATSDYLVWTWNDQGYANELYPGAIYCGFPPIGGEGVHVEAPNNTPNINFALAKPEGSISGRVTSGLTGKPIEGVTVTACYRSWCFCRDSLTGVDGNYTVSGLATEDYALHTSNEQGFIDQWYQEIVYKGSRRPPNIELVPVNSPNDIPDINFVLQVGGAISGKVFDDITGMGIEGLRVMAFGEDHFNKTMQTDDSGDYMISGLVSGKYVVYVNNENDLTYPFYEYYNDAADYNDEKIELIEIVAGSTTGNIDFGMPPAQSIGGNISGIDGETEVCIGLTDAGFPFGGFLGGETCRVGPGDYSIPGLHPDGDYLAFSFGALGSLYFDNTFSPFLAEIVNPPRDDIDFNLNLPGCIEGQITDGSNVPVEDVGIVLYDHETGKVETGINSGSSGNYKFDYLPPKTYQVKVISDSYCSQVKTAQVDSGCMDVSFQLEACPIPCLKLAAGEGSGQVGDRVTLPIFIENLQDQSAVISARFFFDNKKLELSNIRSEAVDIDFYSSPAWEPYFNGYFIIYATFGVAAVGSSILANLDFTILSGTPGEEIVLEIISASTSVCEKANGKIIVSDTANVSFEIEADALNINCKGKVRARVLGVDHFDVRTIDPDSLRLIREGIEDGVVPVRYSYTTGGKKVQEDMLLIFNLPEMVELLMLNEVEGQTIPFILTGQTRDGSPLRGQDYVRLLSDIEKECKSDFDCDADVDGKDALTFKNNFGRSNFQNPCSDEEPCDGDYDGDNDVDGDDAFVFKSDFGKILY